MTSPITRRLLRQAAEAEAPNYYPPKPERCAYRMVREESTSRYVGWCKRAGRQVIYSGHEALTRPICWQHARMNLRGYAAAGVVAQIEEVQA